MFVYSALVALGLVLAAPWWIGRMLTTGRYREGLVERLGRVPSALREQVRGRRVIWVHAVSVGEVLAAERLLRELAAARPDHLIALSTTTATGQQIARERFAGLPVFFFPLDFRFAVRAWLRVLRPELLVLVEGELWPRVLNECRRAGIPVAVVNARVSDRSFRRTRPVRRLWLSMTAPVSLFLTQGEETAGRLRALGLGEEKICNTGNLKYDLLAPTPRPVVARLRELVGDRQLIVAGSTLPGEEQLLLAAWPQVLKLRPHTLLLLAPRHPDRFREVAEQISLCPNPRGFIAMSGLATESASPADGSVLLLDTLGDLAAVYAMASVAFVGGSLVPSGGHNPLEPARFGVPVLMGPSFENFREVVTEMLAAKAIRIVEPEHLAQALTAMLFDGRPMGERALRFFESQSGATARTLAALLELLP